MGWNLVEAPQASCPLFGAHLSTRHHERRLNATGGLLPRYADGAVHRASFSAKRLLSQLAGRTLLLLGDSVSEQHFHSIACTLLGAANHTSPPPQPVRPSASSIASEIWKTRSCLVFAHEVLLCYVTAGKANELHSPPWILAGRLRQALLPSDVVLLNVGLHFSESAAAKQYEQLAGPLMRSSRAVDAKPPLVIYRETSPQHFSGGAYPPVDTSVRGCVPLPSRVEAAPRRNRYNEAINPLAAHDGVPVLRIWQSSSLMHGEHLSPPDDCTHWILPGVPDHWTEELYAMLRAGGGPAADSGPHGGGGVTRGQLLRPLATRPSSLAERWNALRNAFVALPGCVYHQQRRVDIITGMLTGKTHGHAQERTSRTSTSKQGRALSASHAAGVRERGGAVGEPCCELACRAVQLMPHGPPQPQSGSATHPSAWGQGGEVARELSRAHTEQSVPTSGS